jgi:sortase A
VSLKRCRKIFSLPNLLIFLGLFFIVLSFGPLIVQEIWFFIKEAKNQQYSLESGEVVEDSVFGSLLTTAPIKIEPVNRDFAIVIERIGVNAPIVPDVSVTNEEAYEEALKSGVAHAISSDYPSTSPGNVYIFAHASLNFWDLGKYATVFNLLRKLNINDRVNIFYQGDRYIYEVVNKEVVKGWDTTAITRSVIEPILTLQTCDPPGTTINRLVITAKLVEKVEKEE